MPPPSPSPTVSLTCSRTALAFAYHCKPRPKRTGTTTATWPIRRQRQQAFYSSPGFYSPASSWGSNGVGSRQHPAASICDDHPQGQVALLPRELSPPPSSSSPAPIRSTYQSNKTTTTATGTTGISPCLPSNRARPYCTTSTNHQRRRQQQQQPAPSSSSSQCTSLSSPLQSCIRTSSIKRHVHAYTTKSTSSTARDSSSSSSNGKRATASPDTDANTNATNPSAVLSEYYGQTEATILAAALTHVPQLGFTHDALTQGALDTGYLAATARNLFPRGPFDLILYHLITQRESLKTNIQFAHFSTSSFSPSSPSPSSSSSSSSSSAAASPRAPADESDADAQAGTRARVRSLIIARLHGNAAIAQHLPSAIATMTLPSNIAASLRELTLLADEIMHLAGDTSLDSSWYTKRAAVGAVYAAAEAFQAQDASDAFVETERFVERRLADAHALQGASADTAQWLRYTGASTVNVLRSWGVRI